MYWCIPVFSFWQTKSRVPAFSYQVITKVHRSRGYFWNHCFTVWGILISILNKKEAPERIKLSHNVDCFLIPRGKEWHVYILIMDEVWLIQANSEKCDTPPPKKKKGVEDIITRSKAKVRIKKSMNVKDTYWCCTSNNDTSRVLKWVLDKLPDQLIRSHPDDHVVWMSVCLYFRPSYIYLVQYFECKFA